MFAAPPQHGKTETTLALIAFLVLEHPGLRWAYVTYNQKRANAIARKFRVLMASAGGVCAGTLAQMYLPGGGQILFTSIDGGITGEPVDGAVFIDDPYKGRVGPTGADSAARRELVDFTYREAVEPRVHRGASMFLLATRWHPQDLSGTLVEEGWTYINLRAMAEGEVNDNGVVVDDPNGRRVGEALFPAMWPVDALEKKRSRTLDFTWSSLYQGRPRPKGGKVFHEPTYYQALPKQYRGAYGLDLAFTAKTQGDWSACVELWREDRAGEDPYYFVIVVNRAQVEAPEFGLTLKACHVRRPRFKMRWRASGPEKGSAQFLRRLGIPIETKQPPGDKLVSAQDVAAAWNAGHVLVPDPDVFPDCEEWLDPFLAVVSNFTGTSKEKDDDVDALGNAHDALRATDTGEFFSIKSSNRV